jgi:hypothetical protein
LYQHLTKGTNKDTTSSYSDHQHTPDRRPKQSQYTKASGTNSNTMSEQENHTLESNDSISMNSMERVSHQTMNEHPNHQTKSQQHQNRNQRTPVITTSQHSAMHQQLRKNLRHQPHQSPATHTMEEIPESYCSQTNIALASLLLARNNNRPQQIWQLRLLQLQQQRLLSNLTPHQSLLLPIHRRPPHLHNELQDIYKPLYGEPLEALEDLAALGTLLDLEDQEDQKGQEGQEGQEAQEVQEDPLLLQPPQQSRQLQHPPIVMTDSWGVYPSLTRGIENLPEHSLTSWFTTSRQTHKSQD